MFVMKKGSIIPKNIILKDEYKIEKDLITMNISTNKLFDLLKEFVKKQNEEIFLFIEVPTNIEEIKKLSKDLNDEYVDVYYLDGIKVNQIENILNSYGEILINDGLCEFGFGIKSFNEEIMIHKYNVVTIYSKNNIYSYIDILNKLNINKSDNYKSAWDYFTQDNPGISQIYEKEGETIYTIIEDLKKYGLYLGDRKKIN